MFLNWWTLSLFLCFYHGYPLNAWVYMPVSSPRSSNRVTSGDVVFVDKTDDTNSSASRSISILTEICFIFLESATSYTAVGLRFIDEILHTMTRFYRSLGRSFYVWLSSYSRTRALASPIAVYHNALSSLKFCFFSDRTLLPPVSFEFSYKSPPIPFEFSRLFESRFHVCSFGFSMFSFWHRTDCFLIHFGLDFCLFVYGLFLYSILL